MNNASRKDCPGKYAHDSLTFVNASDFVEYLRIRYRKHSYYQAKGYFVRHLKGKYFSSALELNNYCRSQKAGVRHIIKAARVYLNFAAEQGFLDERLIAHYRKVLKMPPTGIDYKIPTDAQVVAAAKALTEDSEISGMYLLLAVSGLRVIEGHRLLKQLHSLESTEHEGFVTVTLNHRRGSKNVNMAFMPTFVWEKLRYEGSSYDGLRKQFLSAKADFSLKHLRKWQYNFLIYHNVPEGVADFIQGRSSKSIGARHYLAKQKQAEHWYSKITLRLDEVLNDYG